eukprot:173944_1
MYQEETNDTNINMPQEEFGDSASIKSTAKNLYHVKKHTIMQQYFDMNCQEIQSNHYQDVLEHTFYVADHNDKYMVCNGKLRVRPQIVEVLGPEDPTFAVLKLVNAVQDLATSYDPETNTLLLRQQLRNYNKHGQSLFLHNRNWYLYQMRLDALRNLRLTFGYLLWDYHLHASRDHFLSDTYYSYLSQEYYRRCLEAGTDDKDFPVLYRKSFEIKDKHCQIILDDVHVLGLSQKNQTINILRDFVSSNDDILPLIVDYMAPWPQIPPEPTKYGYNCDFDVFPIKHDFQTVFWISPERLLDLDHCIVIDVEWTADEMNHRDDVDDMMQRLPPCDATMANLRAFKLTEVYHFYNQRISMDEPKKFVGKLTSNGESLFMYFDGCSYSPSCYFRQYSKNIVLLSMCWMDLWHKIPSICIKADCYRKIMS